LRLARSPKTARGGLIFEHEIAPGIERLPLPEKVCIPLKQHQGCAGTTLVREGDRVTRGQALTAGESYMQVPVHASVAGVVTKVTDNTVNIDTAAYTGSTTQCINPPDYQAWSREQFIQHFHKAGLAGLGGACYPVAAKLNSLPGAAHVLLINAVECDPHISCDEALIAQCPDNIALGIAIAISASGARRCVVGIEETRRPDFRGLANSLQKIKLDNVEIVGIPAVYPGGAESLLFSLTMEPGLSASARLSGVHPTQSGLICFNIATCIAMYKCIYEAQPLISRITTVRDINGSSRNLELPFGTPLTELARVTPGASTGYSTIRRGGHMMGTSVEAGGVIDKSCNSISFQIEPSVKAARECIRCGACADVCPVQLLPQQLYAHSRTLNGTQMQLLKLHQCIECRCCDSVCPSNIPLTQLFKQSKNKLKLRQTAQYEAELAQQRFEKREHRLTQRQTRQSHRLNEKQDTLTTAGPAIHDPKRRLVEEALRRAKEKRKSTSKPASPDSDTTP